MSRTTAIDCSWRARRIRQRLAALLALAAVLALAACNGEDIASLPEAKVLPRCGGAKTGTPTALEHVSRSWWDETGYHGATSTDYLLAGWASGSGYPTLRGYVEFNLVGYTGCVLSASLEVTPESNYTTDPTETFSLWQFTGSSAEVNTDVDATSILQPGTYSDLGSGAKYGGFSVTLASDLNLPKTVPLSSTALDDITAQTGGSFIIGLRADSLTKTPGADEFVRFGIDPSVSTRLNLVLAP